MIANRKNNWVVVGEIIKTYGIKGYVKIISYCDEPTSIFKYEPIIIESTREKIRLDLNLKNINFSKNSFVAEIPSSKIKETSKNLIGEKLLANKKKFKISNKDDFFYSDLENCEVINKENQVIGKIIGIFNFGAGDILEINRYSEQKNILIKFDKKNFPKVDITKKKLILNFKLDDI